jgi:hypothetical protein
MRRGLGRRVAAAQQLPPEVRVPEVLDVVVRAFREVRRNRRPPALGPNQSPLCSHPSRLSKTRDLIQTVQEQTC